MNKESVADEGKRLAEGKLKGLGYRVERGVNRRRPSEIRIIDPKGKSISAFVRTVNGGGWQFAATKYLNLEIDESLGSQKVEGAVKLDDPDSLFILVWLGRTRKQPNRFFVLTHSDIQERIRASYEWWLESHGGGRPDKPASTHCALVTRVLENFADNWESIIHSFSKGPLQTNSL